MADIVQELIVKAPPDRVFRAMSTPEGLAQWWTKATSGEPGGGILPPSRPSISGIHPCCLCRQTTTALYHPNRYFDRQLNNRSAPSP